MYNVSIPEITKEELLSRYRKIKPIVEIDGKKWFLRNFTEKELTNPYTLNAKKDKAEEVNMNEYVALTEYDFECLHKYKHPMFFKPNIADILAQIPESLVRMVDAFEIIKYDEIIDDFNKNKAIFDNGFHTSTVRLYSKK